MFLVIAYDIADDRRRRKIVELMKNYGIRVNYSVFECRLKKKEYPTLKKQIRDIINEKQDSILYYDLCKRCIEKRDSDGIGRPFEPSGIITV